MTEPRVPSPRRRDLVLAGAAGLVAAPVLAQGDRNAPVFKYDKADRHDKLAAAAKQEGRVQVYTSMSAQDANAITDTFAGKYQLEVVLVRASSEEVVQRGVREAKAGLHKCDVFETNGPEMESLRQAKILGEFFSPHFKDLASGGVPAHKQYAASRYNLFALGYNTALVKPEEVPNTLEDLLHPRFAGKLALEGSDTDWFAAAIKFMGEQRGTEFFRKLAETKPRIVNGHTLLATMLASGTVAVSPTVYNHSIERIADKGAPVRWKPVPPVVGRPNCVGPARQARSPNAAMLFIDYLLSPEGQALIAKRHRVPSNRLVKTVLNASSFETLSPTTSLAEAARWEKLWSKLFLGGQKIQKEVE